MLLPPHRRALTDIAPVGGWDEAGLLTLVAAAEADSEHPLGVAVVADTVKPESTDAVAALRRGASKSS